MYCGKNKTALGSQQQIADTLLALMQEKPFSAISVSELCKKSSISRQTFYSLFSSKENIILFLLQKNGCGACCRDNKASEPDFNRICRFYSEYFCENRDLMRLLVQNDLTYLLYDTIYATFMASGCSSSCSNACMNYAAHFMAGGLTGIIKAFILHDPDAGKSELEQTISRLFGSGLFS